MAVEFIEIPDSTEIPVTSENKFIGMRVKPGGDWEYIESPENPIDCIGTIISFNGTPPWSDDDWVLVKWDNGFENVYRVNLHRDLYVVFE